MSIDIKSLAGALTAGKYHQAAEMVAKLRAESGDQPAMARQLAVLASKGHESRLLRLAFALWPEAQAGACERLLLSLTPEQAGYCLRESPELMAAARRIAEAREQELARDVERARKGAEKLSETAKIKAEADAVSRTFSAGFSTPADPAAVASRRGVVERARSKPTVVRGRIRPKLDIEALRAARR